MSEISRLCVHYIRTLCGRRLTIRLVGILTTAALLLAGCTTAKVPISSPTSGLLTTTPTLSPTSKSLTVTPTSSPTPEPSTATTIPVFTISSLPYEGIYRGQFKYAYRKYELALSTWSEWKTDSFDLSITLARPHIGALNTTAMFESWAKTVGYWNLDVTHVSASEPGFGIGEFDVQAIKNTGPLPSGAVLPLLYITDTSKGYGINVVFPNGAFLMTSGPLSVSADGLTLSNSFDDSTFKDATWLVVDAPSGIFQDAHESGQPTEIKRTSWSLTKIASLPDMIDDVLTGIYEDAVGVQSASATAIKEELRGVSKEDLEKALEEIRQYDIDPAWDIYYVLRSQVRANQSLREIPPENIKGYGFLGRSIVKKSILWAEHIQALGWADYPAEEIMSRVIGEMAIKNAMLEADTIISDHYISLE